MAKSKANEWLEQDKLTLLEGWARDGLTDEQIAHNMGIVTSTFYEWKKKYPKFSEVLKKNKEVVDLEVENALLIVLDTPNSVRIDGVTDVEVDPSSSESESIMNDFNELYDSLDLDSKNADEQIKAITLKVIDEMSFCAYSGSTPLKKVLSGCGTSKEYSYLTAFLPA